MMNLSKTLQEDIKINQFNLKAAILNHQNLVVKLRGGNLADPSDVKLKLAGIQKHILSLGEAQKLLLARVKKELANSNSWTNHGTEKAERPNAELRVYPPSANCQDPARKFNNTYQKRTVKEAKVERDGCSEDTDRKRIQDGGSEDTDRKRIQDGGSDAPPTKRVKQILHTSRPSTPVLDTHNYDQGSAPTSSEDSQESLVIDTSTETSKDDFLSAVGLINREQLMLAKNRRASRRRRRHAGHHSQYTSHSHWDLTVRRHRPRESADKEVAGPVVGAAALIASAASIPLTAFHQKPDADMDVDDDCPSVTSPVEECPSVTSLKREAESVSSGCSSPVTVDEGGVPPSEPTPPPLSPDKVVCTVCRKKGILSICDICSTAFHWFCLDKNNKRCPVCLVSQLGTPFPSRGSQKGPSLHAGGDKEVRHLQRYYKRVPSSESSLYAESNGKHKKVDCWRRENERESKENSRHN
ncbi:uncharacterized protein LOC111044583 isoform X2 [Nilaparvata lugens]|uniref:uncharacterized protein LOC111044583 isoform X2 n=1 Tax=Nilaparvata lugens TaxID=108931 RepID=UPI00193E32A8|nr:uncharacterized protein LOC111044583 isoform X2 [Nilaparvata lugens]